MHRFSSSSAATFCLFLLFSAFGVCQVSSQNLPIVVNTWPFVNATQAAWDALLSGHSLEDSVVIGCGVCQKLQCDFSVGYGSNPDDMGETTLDAMVMDGTTMDVGAVGDLRNVKDAVGVARAVMRYSYHTLLAGESATLFAKNMGFKVESLATPKSEQMYADWAKGNCQPNYRQNVSPDPRKYCGPYKPITLMKTESRGPSPWIDNENHDTIGMVAIGKLKNVFVGTSTNGMNHKVHGRVGDSPIMGAGAYASDLGGGAAATGDGDVMMRFLPSYRAVIEMEKGMSPEMAAKVALEPIAKKYPKFSGALVAVNITGHYAAACYGFTTFKISVASPTTQGVKVIPITCQ